jgi:hypothetical protein
MLSIRTTFKTEMYFRINTRIKVIAKTRLIITIKIMVITIMARMIGKILTAVLI